MAAGAFGVAMMVLAMKCFPVSELQNLILALVTHESSYRIPGKNARWAARRRPAPFLARQRISESRRPGQSRLQLSGSGRPRPEIFGRLESAWQSPDRSP